MKFILILLIFISFNRSWAGGPIELNDFLKRNSCSSEIKNLITSWRSQDQWQIEFTQKHQAQMIKTPTKQIGTWILLEKDEDGENISALRLSSKSRLQVRWTQPGCVQKISEISVNEKDAVDAKEHLVFDDSSLEKLIEEKNDGIIYILSTHMHLSVDGLAEIKKVAEQKKIKLTILMDAESKMGFPIIKAQDLVMRGLTMHYPSVILYSKAGQFSGILPGRKSQREYLQFIDEFLK